MRYVHNAYFNQSKNDFTSLKSPVKADELPTETTGLLKAANVKASPVLPILFPCTAPSPKVLLVERTASSSFSSRFLMNSGVWAFAPWSVLLQTNITSTLRFCKVGSDMTCRGRKFVAVGGDYELMQCSQQKAAASRSTSVLSTLEADIFWRPNFTSYFPWRSLALTYLIQMLGQHGLLGHKVYSVHEKQNFEYALKILNCLSSHPRMPRNVNKLHRAFLTLQIFSILLLIWVQSRMQLSKVLWEKSKKCLNL